MRAIAAHGRRSASIKCCSSAPAAPNFSGKRAVVIGGTGRVGSSAARVLLTTFPDLKVAVASRKQESYAAAVKRNPELKNAEFMMCDIDDGASIERSTNHTVLEAAISSGTPYLDVSDDLQFSEKSKTYHEQALAAGVPAIISGGIYPGTSNVMAAHIVSIAKCEYDEDWNYRTPEEGEGVSQTLLRYSYYTAGSGEGVGPTLLRYSYYTAGSGGAGPTILQTSLLLAGEDVVVYKEGKQFTLPALSDRREVDFGTGMGRKGTYLYNLPEVQSAKKYLGVTGCSARFGTDPPFWNWGMWLMARLVPKSLLSDRNWTRAVASALYPVVAALDTVVGSQLALRDLSRLVPKSLLSDRNWNRAVASALYPVVAALDTVVGETVAMKVEVDLEKDKNSSGIFIHKKLSQAMGYSVAGFASAVLQGQTQPGVWYPEQKEALADRREFLKFAATGTQRFDLNKSAWSLESEPIQIGGLVYW
eukprot:gene3013-13034_t